MYLEQLPETILERIFQHLKKSDLFILCWISKEFHTPAKACLYRQILVSDFQYNSKDLPAFKQATSDYTVTNKLNQLTKTLKNNSNLASLVKSLAVNVRVADGEKALLYNLCGNLKEYNFIGECQGTLEFLKIPKVSCDVKHLPYFDTNIRELRLTFVGDPMETRIFSTVADLLLARGAHVKLRTLSIASTGPQYGAPFDWRNRDPAYIDALLDSPWFAFFDRLAEKKESVDLKSLSLEGFVTRPLPSIKYIASTVNLEKLETLEVSISEHSHWKNNHEPGGVFKTFMATLPALCPNVSTFHANHSSSCENCNNEDMMRSVSIFKHNQLRHISIRVPGIPKVNQVALHAAVMHEQKDAISFSYTEETDQVIDNFTDSKEKKAILKIYRQVLLSEEIKRKLTPSFLVSKLGPISTSEENEEILKKSGREIQNLLETDFFYVSASNSMPNLVEYRRYGLCIEMKRNLLVVNGRKFNMAPFQNKAQREKTRDSYYECIKEYMRDYI